MARYLIQSAHDGKGSFVIVIEGRCGIFCGPFPTHYLARQAYRQLCSKGEGDWSAHREQGN